VLSDFPVFGAIKEKERHLTGHSGRIDKAVKANTFTCEHDSREMLFDVT
jgi:hypothetical protein